MIRRLSIAGLGRVQGPAGSAQTAAPCRGNPIHRLFIMGPFESKHLRHINPTTGDWSHREQPGPSSFNEWFRCWKCFRTGMLLLEAAEAERLDAYSEMVRNYVNQFGDEAWSFVSRADSRMRSEHLDRIRRELRAAAQNYGFHEAAPWSACFAAPVRDTEFWQKELSIPAALFLARNKREPRDMGAAPAATGGDGPRKKRALRRHTGDDRQEKVKMAGTATIEKGLRYANCMRRQVRQRQGTRKVPEQ